MADIKISDLPVASALAGTELLPLVQGGVTKQATVADFLAIQRPSGAAGAVTFGNPGVDGSVRIYGDGAGALIIEARVSGVWTETGRITT